MLGGTSLLGGAGSVAATAVGAIFLTQLQQVTIGMGARTSAQFIIQAVIIALGMALRLVPWRQLFAGIGIARDVARCHRRREIARGDPSETSDVKVGDGTLSASSARRPVGPSTGPLWEE